MNKVKIMPLFVATMNSTVKFLHQQLLQCFLYTHQNSMHILLTDGCVSACASFT